MLYNLARAALIGSVAFAVAVVPAAGLAMAQTAPTPVPVPTVPTGTPSAPTQQPPAKPKPTKPKPPSGTTTPTSPPSHHKPVHHRPPTGQHHKPSKGKGKGHGKTGGTKPGSGGRTGKPGGAPGSGRAGKSGSGGSTSSPSGSSDPGRPSRVPTKPGTATPRIIGGADAGDSPWAAQVMWDGQGFECSGTAIAPQWVLTAQHCVSRGGMTVLIGSNTLGQGTKATVDDNEVDPDGDIALLHLDRTVDTAYLPLADKDPKVGSVNDIFGWGKTRDDDSGPAATLRTATVKVKSDNCTDAFQGRAICSTGVTGTAFNGDSGGPEISNGVEVGVCSTGDDVHQGQQYASIAASRDWIKEVAAV